MCNAILHRFRPVGTPAVAVSTMDSTPPAFALLAHSQRARSTLAAPRKARADSLIQRLNTTYLDSVKFTSKATAEPATTAKNRFKLLWLVIRSHS
jgi:hypothetical protein